MYSYYEWQHGSVEHTVPLTGIEGGREGGWDEQMDGGRKRGRERGRVGLTNGWKEEGREGEREETKSGCVYLKDILIVI